MGEVYEDPAACQEPLDHVVFSMERGPPQWSSGIDIRQSDVDSRVFQKQLNHGHVAVLTGQGKGSPPVACFQIDVDGRVGQKQFDKFRVIVVGGEVEGSEVPCIAPVYIKVGIGTQQRLHFGDGASRSGFVQLLFNCRHCGGGKRKRRRKKEKEKEKEKEWKRKRKEKERKKKRRKGGKNKAKDSRRRGRKEGKEGRKKKGDRWIFPPRLQSFLLLLPLSLSFPPSHFPPPAKIYQVSHLSFTSASHLLKRRRRKKKKKKKKKLFLFPTAVFFPYFQPDVQGGSIIPRSSEAHARHKD